MLAHEAFVGMPCSRGASTPPHVCSLYLIDCYILIPADAELVIVLSDTDGVDELFFGPEGIVKGMPCARTQFSQLLNLMLHTTSH